MLSRRGVTLLELVVSLALLGIVCAGVYRVLVSSQRTYFAQTQRLDLQQTLRAAAMLLPAELRELDASDGDIAAMTSTSLTIRAPRQLGFLCAPPEFGPRGVVLTAATLTIREDLFFGSRGFNSTTDSIFVFYEGEPRTSTDDGWLRGRLTADPAPMACADGTPGRRLFAQLVFGVHQHASSEHVPNGAPVRGYEPVTYSMYRAADGRWYLGLQSRLWGSAPQPLVGPLRGAAGVMFEYFDTRGAATAAAAEVAEIRIAVRVESAQPVRQGRGPPTYLTDSLVTRVSLRNNRRRMTDRAGS